MNDSTEVAERKPSYASVPMDMAGGLGSLQPQTLGDVVAFAAVMARADIALPKFLRGNDGACMAVALQAWRWNFDPFMVANKTYSVNDRLGYEAQLIAAVIHERAPIKGRPAYNYTGEGPTRRCQVVCVMADGEEREYTSPMFSQIGTKNSPLWKSDPDQQLGYFSIRSWARRHAPEVILGAYSPEELSEIKDVTPSAIPKAQLFSSKAVVKAQALPDGAIGPEEGVVDGEVIDGPPAPQEAALEPVADTDEPMPTAGVPECVTALLHAESTTEIFDLLMGARQLGATPEEMAWIDETADAARTRLAPDLDEVLDGDNVPDLQLGALDTAEGGATDDASSDVPLYARLTSQAGRREYVSADDWRDALLVKIDATNGPPLQAFWANNREYILAAQAGGITQADAVLKAAHAKGLNTDG